MKSCFLFCCLLLPLWCAAVQPYIPETADPILEPWRWRQEEALDGLGVICMDEAPDGTIWFGNTGSIASYDGVTVKTFPFEEELLLQIRSGRDVPWAKALLVLPDGNPLVLIGESLVLRADNGWRLIIKDVGPSVFTAQLKQGDDGSVWLLVPGKLWHISKDLSGVSVVLKAFPPAELQSFCLDPVGDVWVAEGSEDATSRLIHIPVVNGKPLSDRNIFPAPGNPERAEARLVSDDDGLIWYANASANSEMEWFDPRTETWTPHHSDENQNVYYDLIKGHAGSLWATGRLGWLNGTGRLIQVSGAEGKTFLLDLPFRLPKVRFSLYEDSKNRLWFLGRIGYVYSVDLGEEEWATYNRLHFQCEEPDGTQWFIERENSIVSYHPDSEEWMEYGPEDGMIHNVYRMICTRQGFIWAAGMYNKRAAIVVFDGTRWQRFLHPEFAMWIEPNAVFEALDGTVWFGAGGAELAGVPRAGGALRYRVSPDGSIEFVNHYSPADFPYYITAFAQNPDGTLWIGSTEVRRYDEASGKAIPLSGLQGENSSELIIDQNNALWVAKEHFGVCRLDGDSWRVFNREEGVAGLTLSNMIGLHDGSILAASGAGISRFDGSIWMPDAYPEWFGMSARSSSLRESRDGSIWLNYISSEKPEGVSIDLGRAYRTVRHRPETTPPDTEISSYLERVSQPGNTHITWTGRDPWSTTPLETLRYSWRLDNGEWSAFSPETSRTFLKLHSGMHALEVRARDRAFNIDPTPARIEFRVVPPIWKQAWFISLISVLLSLIGLLIWLLICSRERHLKERQEEREAVLIKQREDREKHLLEQQKQLVERQREREAHLKEVDRIKTGFFTNISHELRTPMTVISGRLQMILESETDGTKKNALSIVLRNAQRVSTLITQLLDFRKLEEGKIKVEATQGDIVPPLRDWVSSLQVLAELARVALILECAEACRGWFDFDKCQKIFTNLISNSIKYTQAGGEIRVILEEQPSDNGARRLRFVVEDTGVGISQEHLAHIFDRFYRVSEASMAFGAGVGLNLTKELVELLGGEIRADSPIHPDAERPGTRFTVFLPMGGEMGKDGARRREDAKEIVTEPEELRAFAPLREINPNLAGEDSPLVLIVEDDEDIRNFIIEGLESAYRVETAENGEIGLQKAQELVPDLIITDIMMPVMDGVTLCRELKTDLKTSHIPVMMLTAKAALDSQIEGLKTGADDYVTKPFHMELLLIRVANLLESRRVLREQFLREYSVLSPKITQNTPEREFLDKVTRVLEENYSDWDFKPERFAAGVHMNVRTLQRKLKAVVNRSPADFINEFRMMRAVELLQGTSFAVTEIAFQVGFDDSSNFTRTFKKYYQMSPSKYREAPERAKPFESNK